MRTFDFTPLWRSSIGFDRLIDLVDAAQRNSEENYPPYNIERVGDNQYQLASRRTMSTSLPSRMLLPSRAVRTRKSGSSFIMEYPRERSDGNLASPIMLR